MKTKGRDDMRCVCGLLLFFLTKWFTPKHKIFITQFLNIMTIQLPATNSPTSELNRNIMQKTLLFLFFSLTPMLIWGQRRGVCDSLFFADGTVVTVDSIKAVEGGLRYRLCGEKYGVLYEAKLTGLKKIRYRNGVQGSRFTKDDTLGKVEISIVPEPPGYHSNLAY